MCIFTVFRVSVNFANFFYLFFITNLSIFVVFVELVFESLLLEVFFFDDFIAFKFKY